MKLSDQVCTREQALLLKQLGVRQDTAYCWISNYNMPVLFGQQGPHFQAAAYTTAELGEMLPNCYETMKTSEGWHGFDMDDDSIPTDEDSYDTEAECRAEIIIYLLQNGKIKLEDVNNALGNCPEIE